MSISLIRPADASRVRAARPCDEDEIMAVCRRLHEENGLLHMSDDKVRQMLRRAFNKEGGIVGVIGEPGHIEGAIYLMISTLWYSHTWILEELFNFVLPEHRKSTNAKDLVEFAKRASEEMGLPLIIGVLSNERTEAKVRLYERQLGKPSGAFFVHNLEKVVA